MSAVRLETRRLVLREYREQDGPAVLAYQRNPRYLRYYPWKERTHRDVQRFLRMVLGWQSETPRRRFQLAVVLRESGVLIGSCGVRQGPDDGAEGEIGFELAPEEWGRGYATEAATAVVTYAFGTLGLERLTARCIAANAASARVLERLGMTLEDRLDAETFKGRTWDVLHYGLSRRRWEDAGAASGLSQPGAGAPAGPRPGPRPRR